MKTRFNTYDIICMIAELKKLVGMRVNQVYDIDNKSYLIRLQRSEEKIVLLLESGNRLHTTQFEWPKNVAPSGFTMKLRKHLKNKRLEKLIQLGIDRVVDLQFGSGEAAYHVILELYDRGNIVLTDCDWTILNVLRPHVEGDKVRFAVKEKYPLDRAKDRQPPPTGDALKAIVASSKPGDNLKKILNPNLECGAGVIDHVLLECGLAGNMKLTADPGGKGFNIERDIEKMETALRLADKLMDDATQNVAKGYIIQKREERPNPGGEPTFLLTNQEFHPLLYNQHKNEPHVEFETFDRAVDNFYSTVEGQKIDLKAIQMEREALKKLQNVKKDHDKRLSELEKLQKNDRIKAELITRNQDLVDKAILAVQTLVANQIPWEEIKQLVKTAQERKDPIASVIKGLKLQTNHISLYLTDPYQYSEEDSDDDTSEAECWHLKPQIVDVDLALTAYANATRYYDQKRSAAKKQQKTLESQDKALKSAERKTKQTLKEVQTLTSISKARKTYWFEKFFWFVSSENYLVIGGRDQQQNELLVKRYMRPSDVYVHADLSGAASIIVKNPSGGDVPPKTLSEAGQLAVAYSVAWEAKVLTSAWWVKASQVSKSAPTGEYLTTGSFMIRGKKNYLLPSHLMLGFSFMFRLEDGCIDRHRGERKVINLSDDAMSEATAQDTNEQEINEQEIVVSDGDDDDPTENKDLEENKNKGRLESISEEILGATDHETEDKCQAEIVENDESEFTHKEEVQSVPQENTLDSNSDSDDSEFNTHIKVDPTTGKVVIESRNRTQSGVSEKSLDSNIGKIESAEDQILDFPKLPNHKSKQQNDKCKNQRHKIEEKDVKKEKNGPKRGQRGKAKKKEKYDEQDDDEKEFMTQWLKSKAVQKEEKKAKKSEQKSKSKSGPRVKIPQPVPQLLEAEDSEGEAEAANDAEQDSQNLASETEILNQLTGCPLAEDELLFAVPVIAPYSVLQNYKFKVKLTPGTGKRGKAAKTAIQVFLKDKACTPRERDLLKAVKEENVARNFPGKVKLSAPQLHKNKK